jgi:hypothetical protein
MAKVKQLLIDIFESTESEETDQYAFPNHPIVPTTTATFCNGRPENDNAEVSAD